jgi:hypothetical protein
MGLGEVKYICKNVTDRKAKVSNGYVAGYTRVLNRDDEVVLFQRNEMSVYSVTDPEFIQVVAVPAEKAENNLA